MARENVLAWPSRRGLTFGAVTVLVACVLTTGATAIALPRSGAPTSSWAPSTLARHRGPHAPLPPHIVTSLRFTPRADAARRARWGRRLTDVGGEFPGACAPRVTLGGSLLGAFDGESRGRDVTLLYDNGLTVTELQEPITLDYPAEIERQMRGRANRRAGFEGRRWWMSDVVFTPVTVGRWQGMARRAADDPAVPGSHFSGGHPPATVDWYDRLLGVHYTVRHDDASVDDLLEVAESVSDGALLGTGYSRQARPPFSSPRVAAADALQGPR